MLHWLPLKEDINHLSPNIQIQILPTDFHTFIIKELLVEKSDKRSCDSPLGDYFTFPLDYVRSYLFSQTVTQ